MQLVVTTVYRLITPSQITSNRRIALTTAFLDFQTIKEIVLLIA
jgi:hypothetical protein